LDGRNIDDMPDVLTVEQFRQVMRIGESQARAFIDSGEICVIRLHQRIIRIPKWAVKQLIGKPAE
jgi:hypothetical protein